MNMTAEGARKWLIAASLAITGLQMVFFLIAPSFNFPLTYPGNLNILQIISPVFLGYLGSASHFIFRSQSTIVLVENQYLGLLVKGPLLIYFFVVTGAIVAFGYSNRYGAPMGSGMSVDNLSTALSLALGLLAVTTGVISSYLFAAPNRYSE